MFRSSAHFSASSELSLEWSIEWVHTFSMTDNQSPARDVEAELTKARDSTFAAIKELELAAWHKGFDAGFARGWETAIHRFKTLMEKSDVAPSHQSTSAPVSLFLQDHDRPRTLRRASDVVLDIIKAHPGIKGVDIVRISVEAGEPVLERTVRTALYRMKRDGQIRNLGGGWYPGLTPANEDQEGEDGA